MSYHLATLLFVLSLLCAITPAQNPTPRENQGESAENRKGILNRSALELPAPVYPPEARANYITGTVSVRVVINESGIVVSAVAFDGPDLLRSTAEEAARRARFSPVLRDGIPVKVSGTIQYNFVDPDATDIGEDEEDYVWSLGAFMALAGADDPLVNAQFGGRESLNNLLIDLTEDMPPAFVPHRPLFEKVAGASGSERRLAADELVAKLKTSLTVAQRWQVDMGTSLGNLVIVVIRSAATYGATGELESALVESQLSELVKLVSQAPKEFAPEMLEKFRRVAALGGNPVDSPAAVNEIMIRIMDIIQALPDS